MKFIICLIPLSIVIMNCAPSVIKYSRIEPITPHPQIGSMKYKSRANMELEVKNKLERGKKFNDIEFEIEKKMLPKYGVIVFEPKRIADLRELEIISKKLTQQCNDLDQRDVETIGGFTGPIGGLGNTTTTSSSIKEPKVFFTCDLNFPLNDSTIVKIKNEKNQIVYEYLIIPNKEN